MFYWTALSHIKPHLAVRKVLPYAQLKLRVVGWEDEITRTQILECEMHMTPPLWQKVKKNERVT